MVRLFRTRKRRRDSDRDGGRMGKWTKQNKNSQSRAPSTCSSCSPYCIIFYYIYIYYRREQRIAPLRPRKMQTVANGNAKTNVSNLSKRLDRKWSDDEEYIIWRLMIPRSGRPANQWWQIIIFCGFVGASLINQIFSTIPRDNNMSPRFLQILQNANQIMILEKGRENYNGTGHYSH